MFKLDLRTFPYFGRLEKAKPANGRSLFGKIWLFVVSWVFSRAREINASVRTEFLDGDTEEIQPAVLSEETVALLRKVKIEVRMLADRTFGQ